MLTSIYCQIQHTSNSSVTYAYVNARGGYSENPTSNWAFCNSAEPSNRYMSVGTQYFIYNSVKENGYTWAALSFKTPKAVTMRGEWSPDSVPQSGVVQIRPFCNRTDSLVLCTETITQVSYEQGDPYRTV